MSCLRILHDNKVSRGYLLGSSFVLGTSTLGSAITASSSVGTMIPENLLEINKSKVWRTVGTSGQLSIELGSSSLIRCIALPFTNLTNTATMRVRGYTLSTDVVAVFDTTALPCCPYSSRIAFGWDTSVPGISTFSRGGGVYAALFFTGASIEKVVIDIADSANPSGYIEIANLAAGDYWEPLYGTPIGIAIGYEDTSINNRSSGGDLFSDIRSLSKKMSFNLATFQESDRQTLMRMLRNNSKVNPVYISAMYGLGVDLEQEYQIYGKFAEAQLATLQTINKFTSPISLAEL